MLKGFDQKIVQLKGLEERLEALTAQRDAMRAEILAYLEKEELTQYKVEGVATITPAIRRTIKYSRPLPDIIKQLQSQKLVKYLTTIPAQIALNNTFADDIKAGNLSIEGVSLEEKSYPQIRFVKD